MLLSSVFLATAEGQNLINAGAGLAVAVGGAAVAAGVELKRWLDKRASDHAPQEQSGRTPNEPDMAAKRAPEEIKVGEVAVGASIGLKRRKTPADLQRWIAARELDDAKAEAAGKLTAYERAQLAIERKALEIQSEQARNARNTLSTGAQFAVVAGGGWSLYELALALAHGLGVG